MFRMCINSNLHDRSKLIQSDAKSKKIKFSHLYSCSTWALFISDVALLQISSRVIEVFMINRFNDFKGDCTSLWFINVTQLINHAKSKSQEKVRITVSGSIAWKAWKFQENWVNVYQIIILFFRKIWAVIPYSNNNLQERRRQYTCWLGFLNFMSPGRLNFLKIFRKLY